jgi:NADH dehydrogenase FAD-containing subunit
VQRAWLTFVIVGGSPTGVELAGTIAELARHGLTQEFLWAYLTFRRGNLLITEAH